MTLFENSLARTRHFYRVDTFVTAHENGSVIDSYNHSEIFDCGDLAKDAQAAREYYDRQSKEYSRKFIFPFAEPGAQSPNDEFSTYGIIIYLVESSGDEDYDYPVAGEDEDSVAEGLQLEKMILQTQ